MLQPIINFLQKLAQEATRIQNFRDNSIGNAIGTIVGGIVLSGLVFPIVAWLVRFPDLSGLWIIDLGYRHSKYGKYRGMLVRYKVLLLHEGNTIRGTAEKIYDRVSERNGNERSYTGLDRVGVKIEGAARKGYFQRSQLTLHFSESGEQREYSTVIRLKCSRFGRALTLLGLFSTTAADSSQLLNVSEYRLMAQ